MELATTLPKITPLVKDRQLEAIETVLEQKKIEATTLKDLPKLLGTIKNKDNEKFLEERLKNGAGALDPEWIIKTLGRVFPLQITFSEPVPLVVNRRYVTKTEHVFANFGTASSGYGLIYVPRRGARRGYHFGVDLLSKVVSVEPVLDKPDEFKSFDRFKSRFDSRFITDAEVQSLWNGKSAQHGGKYTPSDFHGLSRTGLRVVEKFLQRFKSVTEPTPFYSGEPPRLREAYISSGRQSSAFGRDISVEHMAGKPFVWWSSEYPGCGNGRYGILANEKTFLWLEDD